MPKLPKKCAHLQQLAHENDIVYYTFQSRRRTGMTPEEAVSTPLRKPNPYLVKARKKGINSNAFYSRKRYGWSDEEASSIPLRRKRVVPPEAKQKYGDESVVENPIRSYEPEPKPEPTDPYTKYKKVAKEKGIPIAVYNAKIFDEGMSPEEAVK